MFPHSLNAFMDELILVDKKSNDKAKHERKIIAMSAIVSVMREISYQSSLLTNLGIHLHRRYASKYLNNILASLGFTCSYAVVVKFETAAYFSVPLYISNEDFVQMVFDNADMNIITLDGKNAFHAMGGIICVVPKESVHVVETIARGENAFGMYGTTIPFTFRKPAANGLEKLIMLPLELIIEPNLYNKCKAIDNLWICAGIFNESITFGMVLCSNCTITFQSNNDLSTINTS